MKLYLTGVLEEGDRRAGVPFDPRITLHIPQGANLEIIVQVQRTNGQVFQFEGDSYITFSAKRRQADNPPQIVKTSKPDGGIEASFVILPVDTKQLTPGRYLYDVWLTDAHDPLNIKRDQVVGLSSLILGSSVTAVP